MHIHQLMDGRGDQKSRKTLTKRLVLKRLCCCSEARPVHENGRRRGGVSYRNCIFLGDTGNLLALDDTGLVDIVCPAPGVMTKARRDDSPQSHLPAIVETFRAVEPLALNLGKRCGLFSLRHGTAFAIAQHNGKFSFYDTETGKGFGFSCDPQGYGLRPADPGRIGAKFRLCGWIARPPTRIIKDRLPLRHLVDSHIGIADATSGSWHCNSLVPPAEVGFDIQECPCLSAVHVDQNQDKFFFRFFDERTDKHHSIVDLEIPYEMRLRDVCYRSDYCVATSTENSVMLWDVRMLRKDTKRTWLSCFPSEIGHTISPSTSFRDFLRPAIGKIIRMYCFATGDLLLLTENGYSIVDPMRNEVKERISSTKVNGKMLTAVHKNFGILASHDAEGFFKAPSMAIQTIQLCDMYRKESRKRKRDDSDKIMACLVDSETETITNIRSMAFNPSGESLVASSGDGNIFVFI